MNTTRITIDLISFLKSPLIQYNTYLLRAIVEQTFLRDLIHSRFKVDELVILHFRPSLAIPLCLALQPGSPTTMDHLSQAPLPA